METTWEKLALPEISPATDEEILAYLRRSYQLGEIATLTERDKLILKVCEQLDIRVTDEELQAAGDRFRQEYKLLGTSDTLAWFARQRITVEDWSQGIRLSLLEQKLKEHLFGKAVDTAYMGNRDLYRRVALSQIVVSDFTEAAKIVQLLQEEPASFCALALEYSQEKQSRENGGFIGIRFLAQLRLEIAQAIAQAKEGEAIGPIKTKLGYHILRIEKRLPSALNAIREQLLDSLFQAWLHSAIRRKSPPEF